MLATLASLFNVPVPTGNAEDSFDVLRAFTEPKPGAPVRDHVIMQAADATYDLRMGDWKFIERANAPTFESVRNKRKTEAAEKKKKRAASQKDQLFNLQDDPAEEKDVISAQADRAAAMKKFLNDSRDRGYTRIGASR
jgi:arylsulfatase A-like enzyme